MTFPCTENCGKLASHYHVENNFRSPWTVTTDSWKSLPWNKKIILKNDVSGTIILNMNQSLGGKKTKNKTKKHQTKLLAFLSSVALISSPFQLPNSSFLFSGWHLGRMFVAQTFPNSRRWQREKKACIFRGVLIGTLFSFLYLISTAPCVNFLIFVIGHCWRFN